MEIKHYTGAGGKKMVLVDDGHAVVVMEGTVLENVTANALHSSAGSRFNSLQPTVGDLVDVNPKVAASQEPSNPPQPATGVGDLVGQKPYDWQEPLAGKSGVGDLVGQPLGAWHRPPKEVVQGQAAPPVVRINGRFDPLQLTVGDLVENPSLPVGARYASEIRLDDFAMHPRKIRSCSR